MLESDLHAAQHNEEVAVAGPWRAERVIVSLEAEVEQVADKGVEIPVGPETEFLRSKLRGIKRG